MAEAGCELAVGTLNEPDNNREPVTFILLPVPNSLICSMEPEAVSTLKTSVPVDLIVTEPETVAPFWSIIRPFLILNSFAIFRFCLHFLQLLINITNDVF
jgi:hypothetical protein